MNKNETMHLTLTKEQYEALYSLFDTISTSDEEENGEIHFFGTTNMKNVIALSAIGNQIFHNDTMRENLTITIRTDRKCKGCVFCVKTKKDNHNRYYCSKRKSKHKSATGYKVIRVKSNACELYEPKSILG